MGSVTAFKLVCIVVGVARRCDYISGSPSNSSWLPCYTDMLTALPRDGEVERHFQAIIDHEAEIKLAHSAYKNTSFGPRKLTSSPHNRKWPTVTRGELQNRIKDPGSQGRLIDKRAILTLLEEQGRMKSWMQVGVTAVPCPEKIDLCE